MYRVGATRIDDEATVETTVTVSAKMTPEEFESIKRSALWEGLTVGDYLVAAALGKLRRGC
jgi:hypothetical protein